MIQYFSRSQKFDKSQKRLNESRIEIVSCYSFLVLPSSYNKNKTLYNSNITNSFEVRSI